MKFTKIRLVLIILAIIIVLFIITNAITPTTKRIRGEEYFLSDVFYYQLNENSEATLNMIIDESKKDIKIPRKIDGYDVTGLGYVYDEPSLWNVMYKGVFEDNKVLESIYIPDNIRIIEREVFKRSNIVSVVIDSENVTIGSEVFSECKFLKEIVFLKNITTIPTWAFSGCESLEEVELPRGVKKIEEGAFSNCAALKKIILYERVEFIGDRAFEGCDNIIIYGIEGSYVKEYAKEHEIPFMELN